VNSSREISPNQDTVGQLIGNPDTFENSPIIK